jgi:hypothetical protein
LVVLVAARYNEEAVTRKYPLDPLKRVRAEKVDDEARALSRALGDVEATKAEEDRRARAKQEFERSLSDIDAAERAKLELGDLTVADLARGAAFGIAGDMRRATLERSVEEARLGHARARLSADDKRKDLASARTDAELVEKHYDKWSQAERAVELAKEEENAEETHLARSRKRGEK